MKTRIITILAAAAVVLASCAKTEDITGLQSRIDSLKSGEIATIQSQISAINTTIESLKKLDTEMKAYIAGLEAEAKDLEGAQEDQRVALDAINEQIASLKESDAALLKEIEELRTYVDGELINLSDWFNATFATLEQFKILTGDIASLDKKVTSCEEALAGFEKKMSDAYSKAIEDAVSASKTSMANWVNDRITGVYWNIAESQADLDAIKKKITDGDKELQDSIDVQITALAAAKAEITEGYKQALKESIEEYEGTITTTIAEKITEAQTTLQGKIDSINTEIKGIKDRLAKLEAGIPAIIGQIQSVVVVPQYSDGSVALFEAGASTITFDVKPASAIKTLVDKGDLSVFSFKVVETKAAATSSLPVTGAKINAAGQLELTVGTTELVSGFFSGTRSLSASLCIKSADGGTERSSKYFSLYAMKIKLYSTIPSGATVEQL